MSVNYIQDITDHLSNIKKIMDTNHINIKDITTYNIYKTEFDISKREIDGMTNEDYTITEFSLIKPLSSSIINTNEYEWGLDEEYVEEYVNNQNYKDILIKNIDKETVKTDEVDIEVKIEITSSPKQKNDNNTFTKKNYNHKKKYNNSSKESQEKYDKCIVDNVNEYKKMLSQYMRPCKYGEKCNYKKCGFLHFPKSSECEYVYTGEICPNEFNGRCEKIHQKRCKRNLDCNKKNCAFKHVDMMPNDKAKTKYMDTMDEYIKRLESN